MKNRALLILALAAAALAPVVLLGTAEDALGGPCAASVEESRRHMDRGLDYFDHKRFAEAAAEFDAAFAAQPYSAFLVNAAQAYAEVRDYPNAIRRYEAFLLAEPNPPDLIKIRKTLAWLIAQEKAAREAAALADAGADGASPDAADAGPSLLFDFADGGTLAPSPPDLVASIQSQVVVESEPQGAPLRLFAKKPGAAPFKLGDKNPGWEKVTGAARTPYDVSLPAGTYHLVLDAFQDYKASETDLDLVPGRVYAFKANLSQGAFLGFLRVSAPVEGAPIYLDDPPPHRKHPWGRTPYGDLLDSGEHRIWIEVPGFLPFERIVSIEHGKVLEIAAPLEREGYGFLRVDGNAEEVTVKVDGVSYGTYAAIGEPLKIRLPSGPHLLSLEAQGRKPFVGRVEVPRGQEVAVHGRLSYAPPRRDAVLSGALAAGAVVGGVFLLQQPSNHLVKDFTSPIGVRSVPVSEQPWLKVGGAVSLGLAGLLAAATVYTAVVDPNPPSQLKRDEPRDFDGAPSRKSCVSLGRVSPLVGSREGGLLFEGSF